MENKKEIGYVEEVQLVLRKPNARYLSSSEERIEPLSATIIVKGAKMDNKTLNLAIKLEYTYAILGLLLGLSSIIFGSILGLNGVLGSTSWTANFMGARSTINDAAPGVVLFIVGLFMIWVTKPKTHIKNLVDANEANSVNSKSLAAD